MMLSKKSLFIEVCVSFWYGGHKKTGLKMRPVSIFGFLMDYCLSLSSSRFLPASFAKFTNSFSVSHM